MDPKLLEQDRRPVATAEPRPSNDQVHAHNEVVEEHEQQFRDLAIEPAKPPLRVKLVPPVEYDGKQYNELILDFDAMIGKDFQRAEREFQKLYKADKNEMPMPELKHLYHCIIASHLANVPLGVIFKLPRRYYTPLRTEVLKACGSSPDEEKE
jgi:hypothetical protein